MKQIFFFPIIVLFFLCTYIFPQNPEWMIYSSDNIGYNTDGMHCIAIDRNNIKWFGTQNGLLKFNGEEWYLYDTLNSGLRNNRIEKIVVDSSNNKWILDRRYGGTLVKYDGTTWTLYDTTNSILPNGFISCVTVDKNGILWVGTGIGVYSYDNKNWIKYNKKNSDLLSNNVWLTTVDDQNNKWFYCPNGFDSIGIHKALVKFDESTWTTYIDSTEHSDWYWDMTADHDNNIWIGMNGPWGPTEIGLIKFNFTDWVTFSTDNYPLLSDNIYNITVDDYNNKWISSLYGLIKYDGNAWTTFTSKNSGLKNDLTKYLVIDRFNNKWILNGYQTIMVYNETGIITKINEEANRLKTSPANFKLSQNYPNPFNPNTIIKYSIPGEVKIKNSKLKNVVLKVYDILGSEVALLVNENQKPGNYEIEFHGSELTSGIYVYRLRAGDFIDTKKMLLLK